MEHKIIHYTIISGCQYFAFSRSSSVNQDNYHFKNVIQIAILFQSVLIPGWIMHCKCEFHFGNYKNSEQSRSSRPIVSLQRGFGGQNLGRNFEKFRNGEEHQGLAGPCGERLSLNRLRTLGLAVA